ncbi:curli assembly protein CsgF [Alkalimonas sp.]|uniref:curli assembly protein CsgF n=1 Tax=Alkalimonas sp. TaxID=1872453 RepID=UPI00263B813C|nr:curli assembly protein CsgF [Alkalimonas sp.]MCC5825245.1 curli production assembly protein CsgF [Alkalimonas sp.]
MTMKYKLLFLTLFMSAAHGTELVYTPINPSFGGNPLNGAFLLQKAQIHQPGRVEKNFVDKFREALERNIINTLTRRIADGDLVDGIYDTGEFIVNVSSGTDGSIRVEITNQMTGEITILIIPSIGG